MLVLVLWFVILGIIDGFHLPLKSFTARVSFRQSAYMNSKQIQAVFDECKVERTEELDAIFKELLSHSGTVVFNEDLVRRQLRMDELIERNRMQERPADVVRREIEEETSKWKKHADDTGSSEYQIAMLTIRIRHLTTHFLKNKQDKHGKRGMTGLVHQRRKLMNYLYLHDPQKALDMAKALDFTFRPNSRPWDPKQKYKQFTKTTYVKNKRGRLVKTVIKKSNPM